MPTTSVRLRISLLRRSWRLFDQIWLHHHGGHGNLRQTLHLKGVPVDVCADGPKREPRTPVPRALNGLFRPPRSAVKLRSGTELAAMPSLPGLAADPPKSFDLGDPLPRREPSGRGLLVPGDRRPDRGGEADDWRRRGRQRTSALVAVPRRMIVRRAAGLAATGPARPRLCRVRRTPRVDEAPDRLVLLWVGNPDPSGGSFDLASAMTCPSDSRCEGCYIRTRPLSNICSIDFADGLGVGYGGQKFQSCA